MNEEKVIIEYQDKLQEKEVKKFKEATSNYYVLGYIDKLEQENKQLKGSLQTYEILLKVNIEENQQLKEQLQQKEDIINKIIKKCNKEKGRTDFDIFINLNEQLKTLENFSKKIDYNLHPIITEAYKCDIRNSINDLCNTIRYDVIYKDDVLEILDNKGE